MKRRTHDQYSKLPVIRVAQNREGKTVRLKKFIYLCSIVSYEEGDSNDLDLEESTIYIVSEFECFYILGNVDEFNKIMNDYITDIRKIIDSDTNPSE
jgi:hypothetical protein